MHWKGLVVVAVVPPFGSTGLVARNPYVRSPSGSGFMVMDVGEEDVVPHILEDSTQVETRIVSGEWLRTPAWPAQRDHVVLVVSPDFKQAHAIAQTGYTWQTGPQDFELDYLPRDHVANWRRKVAQSLLDWAAANLAQGSTADIEHVLGQALYVASKRDPTGSLLRLYILTGAWVRARRPDRWGSVMREALIDLPETPASFTAAVEALEHDLGLVSPQL